MSSAWKCCQNEFKCVKKSPKWHKMREHVAKMKSNAWKSCQNDVKCMNKSPKWHQMRENVAKMRSNAWKCCHNEAKCVKKSPKWRQTYENVAKKTSNAWKCRQHLLITFLVSLFPLLMDVRHNGPRPQFGSHTWHILVPDSPHHRPLCWQH